MRKRIIIENSKLSLRVFDLEITGKTLTTVYSAEYYDEYTTMFSVFSSRYTMVFNYINSEVFDDDLDVKIPKVYGNFKNRQKHPIMLKYLLFYYSQKMRIPLYRLPVRKVYYVNELREERELSVNALIKATYRLSPIFEKI